MKSAVIFVDNLRIGGIQRLALDESYMLSDMGFKCTVISQEDPRLQSAQLKYFSDIEDNLIKRKNVEIKIFNPNRGKFFLEIKSFLGSSSEIELIVSHSLRASFALKIYKVLFRKRDLIINTKIHQLPSLVDPSQRLKRLIYSQFTDHLFCFSEAVRRTWSIQFGLLFSKLFIFSKNVQVLRNGVYLPRLPELRKPLNATSFRPRLVFLGRLAFWKGLSTLEQLAKEPSLSKYDFLFVIPTYDETSLREISSLLGTRMQVITGKSVNELEVFIGDIHLYPTQYGENSHITESVSLNCLELLGVGIPSIVTAGGQMTWTESDFRKVFLEVNWIDLEDVLNQISNASNFVLDPELHSRLRDIIDIRNEVNFLLT